LYKRGHIGRRIRKSRTQLVHRKLLQMKHSDLKRMCHEYGLMVRLYPLPDSRSFGYTIRHASSPVLFDGSQSLASITTTELYDMSASELESLVLDCSIRSMEGLC
jgi:hypothetical protein